MKHFDGEAVMLIFERGVWALTVLLLASLYVPLPTSQAAEIAPLNEVQSVDYAPLASGAFLIRLALKHPLAQPPAGFRTFHPAARIVLDFPDTALAVNQRNIDVGSRLLRGIRLTQQGNRTRLVIDLETPVRHETALEGNNLLVTLRRIPRTAPGDRFQRFGAAAPHDRTHRIQHVDFRRDGPGAGSVIVRLSDAGVGLNLEQQGRTLILDFVGTGIAPEKELRLDVQDFATPIYTVDTRAVGGNVRMWIETGGQFDYSVYESGLQLNVAVIPVRQEPEVAVSKYR